MQVTTTSYTIAEYCQQMKERKIVVNREYQRSPKVWPLSARSYLIDTVLTGFPMPKICLYEKTDLKTRITTKEIVDGQQRSETILSYYNDGFRVTTANSPYEGRKYSSLQEEDQQRLDRKSVV